MFQVFANGIARRRFHFDRKFATAGEIISAMDWIGKIADKAKVPISTDDYGAEKGMDKLASDIVRASEAIQSVLMDYCDKDARLTISYSNPGSLGGIIGSRYHGPEIFDFDDYGVAKYDFYDLLKRMELNQWGYVSGIFVAMAGYSELWEWGLKPCGARLLMQVNEC